MSYNDVKRQIYGQIGKPVTASGGQTVGKSSGYQNLKQSIYDAIGMKPVDVETRRKTSYINSFLDEANNFYRSVDNDINGENGFNAAEYFQERQKQADSLKKQAAIVNQYLDQYGDSYSQEYYDYLRGYLSQFDTNVDEALSYYQPSLNAQQGLRVYEDEILAAQDQQRKRQAMFDTFLPEMSNPAYGIMNLFRPTVDTSGREVNDQWTDEQKYQLGLMQMESPEDAQKYAREVNAGRDPVQEWQKTEGMKTADLNALQLEVDQMTRQLNDAKLRADQMASQMGNYWEESPFRNQMQLEEADRQIREMEAELSRKQQYLTQAKRVQEGMKFADVIGNADFGDKSVYVSTAYDRPGISNENLDYRLDYSDPVYEYINDTEGVRDQVKLNNRALAGKNYDLMTEDEVGIYNYLYATGGREQAEAYLDNIQETLNQRRGGQIYQNLEDSTFKKIGYGATAGLNQAFTGIENLFNTKDGYIAPTAQSYAGQMARDDLADVGPSMPGFLGGGSLGQVGFDLMNTGANMLPAVAVGMFNPTAGAVMLGASATGNAYQEALNSGYTKEQARAYSTLVGASEVVLEKVLGGITAIGGAMIPNKIINKIVSGFDNALPRAAIAAAKLGGSMVSEGIEEGIQEALAPYIKNMTLLTDESINWEEVAYSSLLGALSGGVMEAPGAAIDSIGYSMNQRRAGAGSSSGSSSGGSVSELTRDGIQAKVSADGRGRIISTNAEADANDFHSIKGGEATIQLKDGSSVPMDDMTFANQEEAARFLTIRSLPGIETEAANDLYHAMADNNSGSDVDTITGVRDAYGFGYYGHDKADASKNGTDASKLSPELRNAAFEAGRKQRAMDAAAAPRLSKAPTVKPSKGYKKVVFEGKVNIAKGTRADAEVRFMDYIAENFSGSAVHVYQSRKGVDGKRYYFDANGKRRLAPNGRYVNDELWIDLNSGDKGEGLALNTFAHEMYHHVEKWNKKGAHKLAEFVVKELGMESVESAVNAQIEKATAAGLGVEYWKNKGKTEEQAINIVEQRAMSDFVADALETMFTRGNPQEAIARLKQEDRGLFDQIKAFIDEWVGKLKQWYSDKTISQEGKKIAEIERFEELQKLFMEAMAEAGSNYNAALQSGEQKNTTPEGDVMFSNRYENQVIEDDRIYLAAINRGDMKTAQKMVDEKAKQWGAFLNNPEANEIFKQSGEVRIFYHGTNTGDFTVFDKGLLGSSSGDLGWFGKGFYFAFSKDEAETYGARVVHAYLKMENPYDYSQLYKFKGSDGGSSRYSRFAWLYNIVKQFPDIAEGQKVYAYSNGSKKVKTVSWKQIAKWMDRIEKEADFSVAQVELSNGETAWELRANPKQNSFTNEDGETFTWTEYGMRQMFATEIDAKIPINQIGAYLVNVMGIEPVSRSAIERIDFSGAVQKAGYDGILQSPSGDEAVVFDPSQIKLADTITYDDSGSVIPLSKRFDFVEEDIRYSIRNDVVDVNGNFYKKVVKPGLTVYESVKHNKKHYITHLNNRIYKRKFNVINADNEPIQIEFARATERVKKDGSNNARLVRGELESTSDRLKMIAIINIKDLLTISTPLAPNNKNNHQWLDAGGWNDRISYMMDNDIVYPVILHIPKTKDGRYLLYDVSVIKKEGSSIDINATALTAQSARAPANQKNGLQSAVKVLEPSTAESLTQPGAGVKNEMNSLRNTTGDIHEVRRKLADAFDAVAKTVLEKKRAGEYREKIARAEALDSDLKIANREIMELGKAKTPTDKARHSQLRRDINRMRTELDEVNKQIRQIEILKSFRDQTKSVTDQYSKSMLQQMRDMQKENIQQQILADRITREELTGKDSDITIMEKEFIRIVKNYEKLDASTGKKITDLRNALKKEAEAHKEDSKIWQREFNRLMREYEASGRKIQRLEDTIARQRATAKARVQSRRNTELRNKIQKKARELNNILLHGSKHRNVPEMLQPAVAEILKAINMEIRDGDSRRKTYEATLLRYDQRIAAETDPAKVSELIEKRNAYAAKGDQFAGRVAKLKNAYDNIRKNKIPGLEIDAGLSDLLDTLFERVGDTPLGQMTSAQLEAVNDVLKITKATIVEANKLFQEGQKAGVEENSQSAMAEVRSAGGVHKLTLPVVGTVMEFSWNNLKPVYAMETIGSKVLKDLYENVRRGEDTLGRNLAEGKAFFQKQWKEYGGRDWDMEKKYRFESTSGKEFQLDLNQIMSIYALSKREQARSHLRNGGFSFESRYKTKEDVKVGPVTLKVGMESTDASAYNLSDEILGEIISKLSPQQRAFVDKMQGYLSNEMAAKGNEVSLKKYGIRLFKEQNYFPLRVADQYMAKKREQQTGDRKLKNSGFTKEVTPEAKNPVVLGGFLDVWGEHVDEMSMYNAFVLPLDDFERVLNYHGQFTENGEATSVVESIRNAYGEGATRYLDNLIRDINGGARTDSVAKSINRMTSKAKKAQTMASLSVAIQQPSAVIRAMAMVDGKYFIGPKVTEMNHGRTWEEMKKYAPITIIKEMGGFDTNVGQSTVEYLTDRTEYNGFLEKAQGLIKDEKYRDEVLGWLPGYMDELAWGAIWNAVKREQRAAHPDMNHSGDAFLKIVADRFTDVVTHTQVYDSVFSRSGMMRSKDTAVKMVTSFMAEPTTTANMLYSALVNAKRGGNKAQLGRTVAALAGALALNSALVSLVYAMRDDEEDKRYDEKWIENFRENVLEGLNPATYIPIIRDIDSMRKGFDIDRTDMSLYGDLMNAINGLTDEDRSAWEKVETVMGATGNLLGIPVKNIIRDGKGLFTTIANALDHDDPATRTGRVMAWRGEDLDDGDQMLLAIQRGDEEHIQRVAGRYDSQDAAERALTSAIGNQYREGKLTAEEATELLGTNTGMDADDIYWKLDEWSYARDNGSSDGYLKYGKLVEAIESGNSAEEIQRYLNNGAEVGTVRSQITRAYKSAYMEGDEDTRMDIRDKVRPAYEALGTEDVDGLFKGWEFEAQYGMSYSDYKAAFLDGDVSESQLREAMDSYGRMQYQIEEDIRDLKKEKAFRDRFHMSLTEMYEAYDHGDIAKNTLISAMEFSGKTREEAREAVTRRDIENRMGIDYMKLDDAYKWGDITRQELYNAMIENGATKQEADEAIVGYDWLKKNVKRYPDLTISDAKKFVVTLGEKSPEETLADYGVGIDAYLKYQQLRPECKGVDANGDGKTDSGTLRDSVFRMIDSLPISDEAKDGLALMSYSMSSIKKNAPWH